MLLFYLESTNPSGWRRLTIKAVFLSRGMAQAQRADDNAVRSASDAFGKSVGNEDIGLYNPFEVRGFSAIDAGNARLDGLYFDQQVDPSPHLAPSRTIRVGISAQGYPLPAPTGIVDYDLARAGKERVLSTVLGYGPFDGSSLEFDAKLPLAGERLGLTLGGTTQHGASETGMTERFWALAGTLAWRPREGVEVVPFASITRNVDTESDPLIFVDGPHLPPRVVRGRFYGQSWADRRATGLNYGVLASAPLAGGWRLKAGVFRSVFDQPQDYVDLYLDTDPTGLARHVMLADRDQRFASTSGELRATREFVDGARLHKLHLIVRARDQDRRYGGTAAVDLGPARIGVIAPIARPDFEYGAQTTDSVRQTTAAIAYQGRYGRSLEVGAGLQRSRYRKQVLAPDLAPADGRDDPWLANASAAWRATPTLALYASVASGLEEGGVAPGSAANRGTASPSIRTRQWDAGVRYALTDALGLIAGVFEVRKPYWGVDPGNVFRRLGEQRSRGIEMSVTGELAPGLNLVAGTVLLQPRISGVEVDAGLIGRTPVGQTRRLIIASAEWQLPWLRGLAVDAGITSVGSRMASTDNRLAIPARSVLDLGARQAFTVGRARATLRLQIGNALDNYGWRTGSAPLFVYNAPRRYAASLAVDF